MKKIFFLLATVVVAFTTCTYAQQGDTANQGFDSSIFSSMVFIESNALSDTDKTPVIAWEKYAEDTSLNYQQIVTICDSLFAVVGQDKPLPTGDPDWSKRLASSLAMASVPLAKST